MHAHYFGNAKRPLFGIYHEPRIGRGSEEAVLLCAPLGHEYLRTHWTMRHLALRLASQGYHVLRFDYSGTGDSGGEPEEVLLQDWVHDVHTAAEELRDESRVRKLSVVGLRWGATLAALAMGRDQACERLVLADVVPRGADYLHEMHVVEERFHSLCDRCVSPTPADVDEECLGFVYSSRLLREIERIDLARLERPATRAIEFVVTTADDIVCQLAERWHNNAEECPIRVVDESAGWTDVRRLGTALLANGLIEGVVASLNASQEMAEVER